jgi:hypothetical protein
MTGYLHALVEDAAREAGTHVAELVAPQRGRRLRNLTEAQHAAIMVAVEAGYSREQIGRVFKRSKRSIVRTVTKMRAHPRYPSFPHADHRRAVHDHAL